MLLLYECAKYPQLKTSNQIATAEDIEPALEDFGRQGDGEGEETFWRWSKFEKYGKFTVILGVTVLFFLFCSFSISGIVSFTPVAAPYGVLVGILALTS